MTTLDQVEINYQAFEKKLPSLIPAYRGKFALMRNEEIIEFFDTARDAYFAGKKIFEKDKLFSVQQITDTPVDLGFFSHAITQR
jgi:hypothetical protein